MLKTIDYIAINSILMLLVFVWTFFIVQNIWWALAISLVSYVLIWSILKLMKNKKAGSYNAQKLSKHFAIMGYSYTAKLIYDNINSKNKQLVDEKYILVSGKSKEIIYPLFKFSNVGYDNVAQIYRLATEQGVKKVYIISSGIDKNALLLANGLNVKFEFVNVDTIYNSLKAKNSLPELVEFNDKPINKMSFKLFLQAIVSPNNTKYYVMIGILFGLMSLITPNRIYYVCLTSISFVLAILTLLPFNKDFSKDKGIFKTTEETENPTDFNKKFLGNTMLDNSTNTTTNDNSNQNTTQSTAEKSNNSDNSSKNTTNTNEKNKDTSSTSEKDKNSTNKNSTSTSEKDKNSTNKNSTSTSENSKADNATKNTNTKTTNK